jgi:peroxiredoxin
MTISIRIGERLPKINLKQTTSQGIQDIDTESFFKGRTVALFAIPGAFTPTCSTIHMPGFTQNMDAFKDKGVTVACLSVNDPFVMEAWGKTTNAHRDIALIADGNGDFTKAIGLILDGSSFGLGLRSLRYSMLVKDGVVTTLNIEANAGECNISSADALLKSL